MHLYSERSSLEGFEIEIFRLVAFSSTPEQWKEWLRVPLEHAAARGNLDLFNKLLGAGANGAAGWRGCRDRTLLDAAALGGNEDIVSGLLGEGAQPDVNVVSVSSGRSALYTATYCGHTAVARGLIAAGADVNFESPGCKRYVLHEAVLGGHGQLVIEMLIGGADLNSRDGCARTSLHLAAAKGNGRMVATLLQRGADKDALNNNGRTPLIIASMMGRLRVVKTLLAAGADSNIRDNNKNSALELASAKGHVPVLHAILARGVDINGCGHTGDTALHHAVFRDQVGAIDALAGAGGDLELKDSLGYTPLMLATRLAPRRSNCTTMLVLLQHGAMVSARDGEGVTALHIACSTPFRGQEALIDLLLRWGADETALDSFGWTPVYAFWQSVGWIPDGSLSQEEIERIHEEIGRARLLLSRAPADRAWRRRGWLVMLRSRDWATKQDAPGCAGEINRQRGQEEPSGSGVDGRDGGSDVPWSDSGAGSEYDEYRQASQGEGVDDEVGAGGAGGDANGGAGLLVGSEMEGACSTGDEDNRECGTVDAEERLQMVVPALLGRGLDGVFRTVVGFL